MGAGPARRGPRGWEVNPLADRVRLRTCQRGPAGQALLVCFRTQVWSKMGSGTGGLGPGIYFSNLVSTSAMRVPPARARSWAPRCSYSAKAWRLRARPSRPTSSRATCRVESDRPGVRSALLATGGGSPVSVLPHTPPLSQ